jgi:NADH-quinone oxidoreductase subunit L
MTRLFLLTFLGRERFKPGKGGVDVHESPWQMVLPLAVLAVLSATGGLLGVPHMSWLEHWLEPIMAHHHTVAAGVSESLEWVLMGVSVFGAACGIFVALRMYRDLAVPAALAKRWATLHRTLWNKWYVDEIFVATIVRPIVALSVFLWKGLDVAVIDRIALSFGRVSLRAGQTAKVLQSGSIQWYALFIVGGIVLSLGYYIYGMA